MTALRPLSDGALALLQALEGRMDALGQRFDARKRKEAEGQMGLDLSGSAKPAGGGSKGKGTGEPCGNGWIPRDKTCRKSGKQAATAPKPRKASLPPVPAVSLAPDGSVLINGMPPKKSLGGGAYGDTFMADGPDGPVVVKVDRLQNGDPMETNPEVSREQQRRNMVERERENMQKAHKLGLASEPIGPVQQLADGRLAFAYRMIPGTKLAVNHRALELTDEAKALLAKPGAMASYAESVRVIARKMADSGFSHGDMHGGNIILGADGSANLVDWGYAATRTPKNAAQIGSEEANALFVLGGGLVNVNSMVDRRAAGRGTKPDIIHALHDTAYRAQEAQFAYKKVIDDYNKEWRADPKNHFGLALVAIREANRLVREEGVDFEEAQRRVGINPQIPPEVEAAAVRERDRIFGLDRLRRFRRAVDQHYAAWKDFSF